MDWKSSPPLRFSWLVLTSSEIQSTQFKGIRCQLLLFQRTTYRRKNVLLKSNLKWKCIQPGMFYRRKQNLTLVLFWRKIVSFIQVQGTSPSEIIRGCRKWASIQPIYRLKLVCSKNMKKEVIKSNKDMSMLIFLCVTLSKAGLSTSKNQPLYT